eukprot:1136927-Pelagomonas_calceolata.AAC.8
MTAATVTLAKGQKRAKVACFVLKYHVEIAEQERTNNLAPCNHSMHVSLQPGSRAYKHLWWRNMAYKKTNITIGQQGVKQKGRKRRQQRRGEQLGGQQFRR